MRVSRLIQSALFAMAFGACCWALAGIAHAQDQDQAQPGATDLQIFSTVNGPGDPVIKIDTSFGPQIQLVGNDSNISEWPTGQNPSLVVMVPVGWVPNFFACDAGTVQLGPPDLRDSLNIDGTSLVSATISVSEPLPDVVTCDVGVVPYVAPSLTLAVQIDGVDDGSKLAITTQTPARSTEIGSGESFVFEPDFTQATSITGQAPAGWRITSAGCSGGDLFTISANGSQIMANAAAFPGDEFECTAVMRAVTPQSVTIETVLVGGDSDETFAYFVSGYPIASTSTAGAGTIGPLFFPNDEAAIIFSQTPPPGWQLTQASCGENAVVISNGSALLDFLAREGQVLTCEFFYNEVGKASITITKEVIGADGGEQFQFVKDSEQVFFLANGESQSFEEFPGSYLFVEPLIPGFATTGACTGTDDWSFLTSFDGQEAWLSVASATGENIECTFTNTMIEQPTVTIINVIEGDADTTPFMFEYSAIDAQDFYLLGSGEQATFTASPGTGTIRQTIVAGYALTSIACAGLEAQTSIDAANAQFELSMGDDIICTFTSTSIDAPTLQLFVTTDDGTVVTFDGDLSLYQPIGPVPDPFVGQSVPITTGVLTTPVSINPGTYRFGLLSGEWVTTAASCQGATFEPWTEGQFGIVFTVADTDVICSFELTKPPVATVTVVKEVVGDAGAAEFRIVIGDQSVTLMAGEQASLEVSVGSVFAFELNPVGWTTSNVECDGQPLFGLLEVTDAGSTCVFTSVSADTRNIEVNAVVAGTTQQPDFLFQADFGLGELVPFTVTPGAPTQLTSSTTRFAALIPEAAVGYQVATASCDQGAGEWSFFVEILVVSPSFPNELLTDSDFSCTFVFVPVTPPQLTIVHEIVGFDDGTLVDFTTTPQDNVALVNPSSPYRDRSPLIAAQLGGGASQTVDLAVGDTIVTQTTPPGWAPPVIRCEPSVRHNLRVVPDDQVGTAVNVSLSAGEQATCTFTNQLLVQPETGTLVITKSADPEAPEVDNAATAAPAFMFAGPYGQSWTMGDGESFSLTVEAGVPITVSETALAGWVLTGATCDGPGAARADGSLTVTVAANATVTCSFVSQPAAVPVTVTPTPEPTVVRLPQAEFAPEVFAAAYGPAAEPVAVDTPVAQQAPATTQLAVTGNDAANKLAIAFASIGAGTFLLGWQRRRQHTT